MDSWPGILDAFTPVYNELIYHPNKEKFEKQLKSLSDYFVSKNVAGYFQTGVLFYNSVWDNSIPFEIALYPLPDPKGFTAEAFINNAVCAIPTNEGNYDGLLSIMMHEIFHMIYNEQSLKVKEDMKRWFNANPSKCSTYAFWLMNEAFATVFRRNGYKFMKGSMGQLTPRTGTIKNTSTLWPGNCTLLLQNISLRRSLSTRILSTVTLNCAQYK